MSNKSGDLFLRGQVSYLPYVSPGSVTKTATEALNIHSFERMPTSPSLFFCVCVCLCVDRLLQHFTNEQMKEQEGGGEKRCHARNPSSFLSLQHGSVFLPLFSRAIVWLKVKTQ